jgi:hypothetical protein
MSEWQPIETAPKDRPILVYCPESVKISETTYCWPEETRMNVVVAHWHAPDRQTDDEAGWYAPWTDFDGGVWDDPCATFESVLLEPTHWMPLPDPPA